MDPLIAVWVHHRQLQIFGRRLRVASTIAALARRTVGQLRLKFAELFGEQTRTGNKAWLIKRIAWQLQALAEGDLSQR